MTGRGRPCTECGLYESCTNPAKETRGRDYIGCAKNAPEAVGEVDDILTTRVGGKLGDSGYVLIDMWLENDGKTLLARFGPDPAKDTDQGEVLIDEQYDFKEVDPDAVREMIKEDLSVDTLGNKYKV